MNHVFDVMASATSQLNIISRHYNGTGTLNTLPKVPDFVSASVERMLNTISNIVVDATKDNVIEMVTRTKTGDVFAPLYMCVVDNIKYAGVDKVSVIIDHKGNHGAGIATIIMIPASIFNTDNYDIEGICHCFRDIYFELLDNDVNMSYASSPAMIRLYNNPKIRIPTYDIEMVIVAICCMNLNTREWFYNGNDPVGPEFILSKAFTEKELDEECCKRLINVMKRCNSVSDIHDALSNGRILTNFTKD